MEVVETTKPVEREFTIKLTEDEAIALAAIIGMVPGISSIVSVTEFKSRENPDTFIKGTSEGGRSMYNLYHLLTDKLGCIWWKSEKTLELHTI